MSRDDIVEVLRGELALIPEHLDYETVFTCFDALRDACAYIVKKYDEEVQP